MDRLVATKVDWQAMDIATNMAMKEVVAKDTLVKGPLVKDTAGLEMQMGRPGWQEQPLANQG